MLVSRASSRTALLASAAALTMPLSLALAAGEANPPAGSTPVQSRAELITQAQHLLDQGRPVAARALLSAAFAQRGEELDDATSKQLADLVQDANRRMRELAPSELSVQKAELALADGDVRAAQQHVRAVLSSSNATAETKARAAELQTQVAARRTELEAIIPETLAQAEKDYLAGRYAAAKSGLSLVDRSGVPLSADQQATLDRYQLALVELADTKPELFTQPALASRLQPGVVRRRENEPPAQPASQPEPVMAQAQPASEPPAAQPASQPAAQPGDAVGDPIRQARVSELTDLLNQADRAFQEKRYAEALTRYERVRSDFRDVLTGEQSSLVDQRISEARTMLGTNRLGEPQGQETRVLAKQQAQAEFENDLAAATRALSEGNVPEARNRVALADLRLSQNRDVFSEGELEALRARAKKLQDDITKESDRIAAEQAQRRDTELQARTAEAEKNSRAERSRKIDELIERARAFQAEKRYREALQTVDQLLFLDPNNVTGKLLREVYFDVILFDRAETAYRKKQEIRGALSVDAQEATVPPLDFMEFPADWPAISARRGEPVQFSEPPETRRVMADLGSRRIPSASFADNTLEEVVRFVQTAGGLNMDVDWASLETAGVNRSTTVSLNLTQVTYRQLLDRLVEKISGTDRLSRVDWAVLDGVVTIASDAKLRRNRVLVIYDVKDLLIDIPDFRDAPRIDLQQALQAAANRGGGGGQSPFQNDNENDQQFRDQREGIRRQRIDELQRILTDNVDPEGWVVTGGETGTIQPLYNQGSFIILNTPKNHREITGLLRKLREVRAMQINVECRFLLVNQDFFEQIGFDLDIYFNANNNQVRAGRAINPSLQARDFFDFTSQGPGLNRSIPQTFAFSGGGGGTNPPVFSPVNPTSWSPIGFGGNSLGLGQSLVPRSANWGDLILNRAPALGIAGQFLDDVQVDFLIKATQADRRSVQLTAPRLTFTNGQTSNIYVATQTAFVSELQPIVGQSAVGFQPTVGVVTEGVTMLVEGTITADRRYVTMTIDTGVSRVNGFAQQSVSAVAGGQLVNSAAVNSFIQLPQVTVTRVRTTVTVPDQGTLLLGGQRLVTEYEVETGVPVLSKIPVLNRFFTNRVESREEQTLLVLVKPTILIQNEEEERNFPGLLQSLGVGGGN